MAKKIVIVNVNLQYVVNARDDADAITQVCNVELPHEYVEDSFEIVKVITKEKKYPKDKEAIHAYIEKKSKEPMSRKEYRAHVEGDDKTGVPSPAADFH